MLQCLVNWFKSGILMYHAGLLSRAHLNPLQHSGLEAVALHWEGSPLKWISLHHAQD